MSLKAFSEEGLQKLAQIVRTARGKNSLNRFAAITGISYMTLGRLEKGNIEPKLETLAKLAQSIDWSYHELLLIVTGQESDGKQQIRQLKEKIEKIQPLKHDPDAAELLLKWEAQLTQLQQASYPMYSCK